MTTTKTERPTHKHWPGDHPLYGKAPWCRFRTIKACDENNTQFQHGHLGRPCVKAIQESKTRKGEPNKIATCTLIVEPPEGAGTFKAILRWQFSLAPDEWWDTLWVWQDRHGEARTERPPSRAE